MEFLILVLLSVPFFYIYGVISFIMFLNRSMKHGKEIKEQEAAPGLLERLKTAAADHPQMTLKEFLDGKLVKEPQASSEGTEVAHTATHAPAKATHEHQSDDVVGNWYKNNSVNLLLYIGAFLIITAAAIFVGFQWDTIPGTVKASLLTLLAMIFFFSGMWFYTLPKIKNAGATFIVIAAVLIPVLGSAWYNFVLQDLGVSVGTTWFFTSAIAIATYLFLTTRYRNVFYAYASTIGTFSLFLSLVSTFKLDDNFYILAGILANFFLLFVHTFLEKHQGKTISFVSTPYKISSQVLMPITLFYGFSVALTEEKLYTLEGVLSVALASIFYFAMYRLTQKLVNLVLAEIFLPVAIVLFVNWQNFSDPTIYYLLDFCALGYALAAYWFTTKKDKLQQTDLNLVLSLFLSFFVVVASWETAPPIRSILFTLITLCITFFATYLKKKPTLLLMATVLVALLIYDTQSRLFNLPQEYFAISFAVLGTLTYSLCLYFRQQKDYLHVSGLSTVFYLSISLINSTTNDWYLFSVLLVIAFICFAVTVQFKKSQYLYGTIFFALIALIVFLDATQVNLSYYPLILSCYAYLLYGLSIQTTKEYQHKLLRSSLGLGILIPFFYGITSYGESAYDINQHNVERNALIAAYGATILYGLYYMMYQTKNFGYLTSAIGLTTFLWQLQFLGVTESLMYTATLGCYFLILGYTRRVVKDYTNQDTLTVIGLLFLLAPPILASFGDDPTRYSLFLGFTGILLTALGISMAYRKYKYGGIIGIVAAVLPQTYNYILSLPRWVVVGLVGMIFIGTAIFLLLRRGEHHNK